MAICAAFVLVLFIDLVIDSYTCWGNIRKVLNLLHLAIPGNRQQASLSETLYVGGWAVNVCLLWLSYHDSIKVCDNLIWQVILSILLIRIIV